LPDLLETNLNQYPYNSDYDPSSQYYNVLFKPSVAVQTREMNVLQEALYHQIYRLGQNLFVSGTIISGCNITTNPNIPYVKILDTYANNVPISSTSSLINNYLISNSGLTAKIVNSIDGLVSLSPNLNTLYIAYLNSVKNASTNTTISVFRNDEILSIITGSNTLIAQVTVANTISSGSSNTTGYGYQVSVDDGVIFQKGYMLEVKKQGIFVSPYTINPSDLSVGFTSVETIVTSYQDQTLVDNSQGSPNQFATGADRLKITPTLTYIKTTAANSLVNNFFSIIDFVGGQPSVVNQNTVYSVIGDNMANRSFETNGNFIVKPFNIRALRFSGSNNNIIDPNYARVEIDKGEAYVNGYRVAVDGQLLYLIQKGTDYKQVNNGIISSAMGDYIQVNETSGIFDSTTYQTVSLLDAPCYSVSNGLSLGISPNSLSPSSNVIGSAQLYSFKYSSGISSKFDASYLVYLVNIQMLNGRGFQATKGIKTVNGSNVGYADVILNSLGKAELQNTNYAAKILNTNQSAIKTFKTASNTIDMQFFIKAKSNINIPVSGNVSITIPSYAGANSQLPYGTGSLDKPTITSDIMFVSETNTHSANISGSVNVISGNTSVTGNSTTFTTLTYLNNGVYITLANSSSTESRQISSITNNTLLTTTKPFSSSWSSANMYISYLSGEIIPLTAYNANVNIVNSSVMTLALPTTINQTMNTAIFYTILLNNVSPAKKYLQNKVYVKIDCSNNIANSVGPWCLGIPDAFSISNIWMGSSYSNSNPSYESNFSLDEGARKDQYQQSYLYNSGAPVTGTSKILIEMQCFVSDFSSGANFYTIDSYPIDDTGVTSNTIYTQQTSFYRDNISNKNYLLRNCLDFRPLSVTSIPLISDINTAITSTAIINPMVNNSISSVTSSCVIPDTLIESSYQYYMGRYDKIGLTVNGNIAYNRGNPSENPNPPIDITSGITLAMFYVPPYPSLTPDTPNLNFFPYSPLITTTYYPNKRYTMADIGTLDHRLQQVEYYTSLSVLEQSAQNLLLTNQAGQTRFKNGILVDPMNDFSIANTISSEFNIAIDSTASVARPVFQHDLINLKVGSLSGTVVSNNRLITLQYAESNPPAVSQPFASQLRNASQERLWIWDGNLLLNPPGDYNPDITENPMVNLTLDQYSNWSNLPHAWSTQWGTWNEIASVNTVSSQVGTSVNTSASATTTTSTTTTTTTSQQIGAQISLNPETSTYSFGDVVTGVSIQPYVKQQLVKFQAHGLKPNSELYLFINDTKGFNKYNLCTDAPIESGSYNVINNSGYFFTGPNGSMYGQFSIPAKTFYTGILNIQFVDVEDLTTGLNVITTKTSTQFFAQNLSYTQNKLQLTTIEPVISYNYISNYITNNYISNVSSNVVVNTFIITQDRGSHIPIINTPYFGTPHGGGQGGAGAAGSAGPGSGSPDPIAQSFEIQQNQLPNGLEGVYVTSIDLFFESRAGDVYLDANNLAQTNSQLWDSNLGITVQIQPVSNGNIQDIVIPFSRISIDPINVHRSAGSHIPCYITFPAPVFLAAGQLYAIVITPDGSNPYYNMWSAVIGANDLVTKSQIYNFSSVGDMFLSSQGLTWNAYSNENLKFNVYCAVFAQNQGYVTFNNEDYDYIKLSSLIKGFNQGELVAFTNNYIANSLANVVISSNVLTIPSTSGLLVTTNVGIISIGQQNSFTTTISSIINSTAITLANSSVFTDANATLVILKNYKGTVISSNITNIVVYNPNINNSNYLTTNIGYVLGVTTGSYANGILTDVPYDTICPKFSQSVPSECTISYNMIGYSNNYVIDNGYTQLNYNTDTTFLDKERVILSKSNEMLHLSGNKSLTINVALTTTSQLISPALDIAKMGVITIYNKVNTDDANSSIFYSEITNSGNAINKYISTTVTLSEGLDAEDMIVYLGAYYPPGTTIYVYGKIQNKYDSGLFDSMPWSPMYCNNAYRSSTINIDDLDEYIYTFPQANTPNNTAYIDTSNSNVISYKSPDGNIYGTYNKFALKIVLLSNTSQIVPRIMDYRLLALQS
jgi:hypothetical protein